MNDMAQVKQQLNEFMATLSARRSAAQKRQQDAQQEIESTQRELEVIEKTFEGLKAATGYYSASATITAVPRVERGSNRNIVIDILTQHAAPMTNSEIAKVAHEQGAIKSKKGQKGVYATVATVLARGKNVFVNHNGQWDLRSRQVFARAVQHGEMPSGPLPPTGSPILAERVRVAKMGIQ
jgi:hypothetical protein